jgi:hypothetical protein
MAMSPVCKLATMAITPSHALLFNTALRFVFMLCSLVGMSL